MSSTDLSRALLDRAFTFAVYCLGSRGPALDALGHAVDAAQATGDPPDSDTFLRLVRDAIGRSPRGRARPATETLPAVWSGEMTREVPGSISEDAARSAALTGALRRLCFTAVLRSIAETPRCAFVLRHVLGLPDPSVARILGTNPANLHTLRARSHHPIEQALGPHCAHFDRNNACSCPGRLGLALAEGSISEADIEPATDPEPRCTGDLERLFRTLPLHRLTDAEAAPLLARLRADPGAT